MWAQSVSYKDKGTDETSVDSRDSTHSRSRDKVREEVKSQDTLMSRIRVSEGVCFKYALIQQNSSVTDQ